MTVKLTGNFLATARCLIYQDGNAITWSFNPNTNQLTAAYTGAGSAGSANPSASIGLTAVNGTAATWMTSDSAPPLNVGIIPTWTGLHTFSAGLTVNAGTTTISGHALTLTSTFSGGGTTSGTNTGDQTSVSGSSGSCTGNAATATTATNVAYSGLTGSVPTWNQNTSGSSASCTGNAATATTAGACSGNSATATSATTATNVTGGLAGSLPYQTGAGATTTLAIGLAGKYLTVNAGATAPQWSALPAIPASANPSASIGLSAVNGSATTFMTSDSAPALSVAITPTWTAAHTFTPGTAVPGITVTQNNATYGLLINGTAAEGLRINTTNAAGSYAQFYNSGTFNGYIGSAKAQFSGALGDFAIGCNASQQLVFGVNVTPYWTMTSAGAIVTKKALADQSYSLQVPLTGFSITIPDGCNQLILNPAGTLATGTVTMPANPVDGQRVGLCTSQVITTFTLSANTGQSLDYGGGITFSYAQSYSFIYTAASKIWFRTS